MPLFSDTSTCFFCPLIALSLDLSGTIFVSSNESVIVVLILFALKLLSMIEEQQTLVAISNLFSYR